MTDFNTFWSIYPRKVAKKAARKAWDKIDPKLYPTILESLSVWRRVWSTKDQEYIPHASSWLHGERWEDEVPRGYRPVVIEKTEPVAVDPEGLAKVHDIVQALVAKMRVK